MQEKKKVNPLRKAVDYLIYKEIITKDGDVAKDLNINKGTVSSYLSGNIPPSKTFTENFEKHYKVSLQTFLENEEMNAKNETSTKPVGSKNEGQSIQAIALQNLSESNRLMAEANKIQAEANKIQAESNRQLVESNRELTAMIKASTTAGAGPEIPVAVAAKFEDLLAVVAEIVGGKKHYKSPNEAFAEIHRLFYDPGTKERSEGTRTDEGIVRIEK